MTDTFQKANFPKQPQMRKWPIVRHSRSSLLSFASITRTLARTEYCWTKRIKKWFLNGPWNFKYHWLNKWNEIQSTQFIILHLNRSSTRTKSCSTLFDFYLKWIFQFSRGKSLKDTIEYATASTLFRAPETTTFIKICNILLAVNGSGKNSQKTDLNRNKLHYNLKQLINLGTAAILFFSTRCHSKCIKNNFDASAAKFQSTAYLIGKMMFWENGTKERRPKLL